jgi:hypothetical protein
MYAQQQRKNPLGKQSIIYNLDDDFQIHFHVHKHLSHLYDMNLCKI